VVTGERGLVDSDELSALRRLATLVARGVPAPEIFHAVSEEVSRVLGQDLAAVGRFDDDGTGITVVGLAREVGGVTVGSRGELGDGTSTGAVYRTGRAARVDGRSTVDAPLRSVSRDLGIVSSVSSPIVVEGRLWGAVTLAGHETLALDTEERLSKFTELLEVAIANAESHAALERLAEEQAALRRVATLVARGASASTVFMAVSEEVGRLFGEDLAAVARFEADGSALTIVGGTKVGGIEIGMRAAITEETPMGIVYATGRPARIDRADWSTARSPLGRIAGSLALVSGVASPIIVEGRLWGAMSAIARTRLLPPDTEQRLERFSELVATAIANVESHEALERLAEEQAALRRVATLVARGSPAETVFTAVSEEVGQLFGEGLAAVARFDDDGRAITFVGVGSVMEGVEVGARLELTDETPLGLVYATSRSARVDRADWSTPDSPLGQMADRLAVFSAVSSPIIVEGRLWGATNIASTQLLPADTEHRLERFSELVAVAIADAESRTELAASRRRIVTASDEARRRIERDLHDGTQQRLVSLGLSVRVAEGDVPVELTELRAQLSKIATGLADAATELQEISRGIHPAILSRRGIGAALRMLARRSPVPVDVAITVPGRLPENVEVAAYYVASEALANAAKHARASHIGLSLEPRGDRVVVSISDDGIGGADADGGSGLVGLRDRLAAVGGSIDVQSVTGAGTRITAEIPLEPGSGAVDR
jgi:signal transduction histidine kinase